MFSINVGMFWDNVLFASKMGNYLYNNGLFNWHFPDAINPGHPPFLAFIQAAGWKLLGRKLWVSHLVMLPFVFGLLYQLYLLVEFYIKKEAWRIFAFFLILAEPTFFTQLILVDPEVIQLFFFFLAINSVLRDNKFFKTAALFFLSVVSFRGMILCGGVFLFDVLRQLWIDKKSLRAIFSYEFILSYAIGAIPGLSYIAWRLLSEGWLLTHPGSPWEGSSNFVTIKGLAYNIVVLIHRFADFGRIGVLIFLAVILMVRMQWFKERQIQDILLLACSSVIIVVVIALVLANSFGHRYFIASYIVLNLLAFLLLIKLKKSVRLIIYTLLITLLISGNLWIYPEKISQGWDASLAHLPYYHLRDEAINYLDKNNIKIEETGTFFPNAAALDEINLNGDKRKFPRFNGNSTYVFYSNVYNLTDKDYDLLKNRYITIKEFKNRGIFIKILKKRTSVKQTMEIRLKKGISF
jgi:hypothetical protein